MNLQNTVDHAHENKLHSIQLAGLPVVAVLNSAVAYF
jgi:hypothetical protein